MKTRDEKIKAALAKAYSAVNEAIVNEDGLDGSDAGKVMRDILRLFKHPFPLVRHKKMPECKIAGKHNVSECGLSVDLNKKGFELIGKSDSSVDVQAQEEVVAALWDFMRNAYPVVRFGADEPTDPKFLEAVGNAAKRILAAFGKEMVDIQ